jgi:hypothetical protein
MRTRVGKNPLTLIAIILVMLGSSILILAECPNCFWNVKRMSGHGTTADGRTKINVQISFSGTGSWNDPGTSTTNANIWNGVNNANANWNNQTSGGQHINYSLGVDQTVSQANVDVRIVQGNLTPPTIGQTRGTKDSAGNVGPPFTIILVPGAQNWTASYLQSVIAHEIGHLLGLAHSPGFNTCGHTIMNHSSTGGRVTGSVQPQDVAEARKQFNNPGSCSDQFIAPAPPPTTGTPTPTPTPSVTPTPSGCVDQDHDGVCFFDDCDDNDPTVAYDSDGDHYCYPDDCDDYNANIYPGAPLNPNTEGGEDRDCNGVDDYQQQYGGGGGGGGGYCTPYYWVYYESYDGGNTWYVVDIQYAGCW